MAEAARTPRVRSKNDPERRQRIIDATARIIGERGIDAVTFRNVAAEAGIPLGSTTYYFADKDDLLLATIHFIRNESGTRFDEILSEQVPKVGLARGTANMIQEVSGPWHETLKTGYGVYLSSFSRPSLREEISAWHAESQELFVPHTDPTTARALSYLVDGLLVQAALVDIQHLADDVLPLIERVISTDA